MPQKRYKDDVFHVEDLVPDDQNLYKHDDDERQRRRERHRRWERWQAFKEEFLGIYLWWFGAIGLAPILSKDKVSSYAPIKRPQNSRIWSGLEMSKIRSRITRSLAG